MMGMVKEGKGRGGEKERELVSDGKYSYISDGK